MVRLILEGTASKLRVVRQRDLPLDKQAPNAYLAYCVLDGLDFSGFNLWNLTTYRCSARNTIWTGTDVEWWYSRYTGLTGCTPPTEISSLNHDLVVALIRREIVRQGLVGRQANMLGWIADHVATSYENSWNETMWRLHNELGYTVKEMQEYADPIFRTYPRLARRLAMEFGNEWSPEKPQVGPCAVQIPDFPIEITKTHTIIAQRVTNDRVLLQERIAAYLKQQTGNDYNVWLREIEPEIRIYISPRAALAEPDSPEWWREERM